MRIIPFTTELYRENDEITVEVESQVSRGIGATLLDPDIPAIAEIISVRHDDEELIETLTENQIDALKTEALRIADEEAYYGGADEETDYL